MTTAYDVPADMLIKKAASELQKNDKIQPPEWAEYVKTGVHRESAPVQKDWWYTRTAAVLRKVYVKGPIGVSRLRAEWGGKVDRGSKPYKARKGSGSIVRKALQQLESAGYISKDRQKGRVVTPQGQKLLDNLSHSIKTELISTNPEMAKY
jgi:small subunit ribosomal protein S19e